MRPLYRGFCEYSIISWRRSYSDNPACDPITITSSRLELETGLNVNGKWTPALLNIKASESLTCTLFIHDLHVNVNFCKLDLYQFERYVKVHRACLCGSITPALLSDYRTQVVRGKIRFKKKKNTGEVTKCESITINLEPGLNFINPKTLPLSLIPKCICPVIPYL